MQNNRIKILKKNKEEGLVKQKLLEDKISLYEKKNLWFTKKNKS